MMPLFATMCTRSVSLAIFQQVFLLETFITRTSQFFFSGLQCCEFIIHQTSRADHNTHILFDIVWVLGFYYFLPGDHWQLILGKDV